MTKIHELKTERLLLRQWRDEDLPLFAKLNADPDVMQYYPATLSDKESNAMAQRIITAIVDNGWGFWAVERIQDKAFIGFVGLNEPDYKLPVTPCVEIGWRLESECWGKAYATEAAIECMKFAFESLSLEQVYSFASVNNSRSIAVMKRLNMANTNTNFDHPMLVDNPELSEHVLYKIDRQQWQKFKD